VEVSALSQKIEDFYHLKTVVHPSKKLPKSAFVNVKSPRYKADSSIRFHNKNLPDSLDFIMVLTNKDVLVTKKEADGSIKKPEWKYADFGVKALA